MPTNCIIIIITIKILFTSHVTTLLVGRLIKKIKIHKRKTISRDFVLCAFSTFR